MPSSFVGRGVKKLSEADEMGRSPALVNSVSPVNVSVEASVNGRSVRALVDSGSSVTIISCDQFEGLPNTLCVNPAPRLVAVDGTELRVTGCVELSICISNRVFVHTFVIADVCHDIVLGADFLHSHKCVLDVSQSQLVIDTLCIPISVSVRRGSTASNIVSVPVSVPTVCDSSDPVCSSDTSVTEPDAFVTRVCTQASVTVPAEHCVCVPCQLVDACETSSDLLCDPLVSFLDGHPSVAVVPALVHVPAGATRNVMLVIENHDTSPLTLHKNTHIATASNINHIEDSIHETECTSAVRDEQPVLTDERRTFIDSYIKSQHHLSTENKLSLTKLLHEYHDLFIIQESDHGYCDIFPHKINTGSAKPIKQATRRIPYHRRQALEKLLNDLKERGIITESMSPWAAPIVLVPKKDGNLRLCIDYRKLNDVTQADAYPIPRVDDMLDSLHGCQYFSSLDLATGYWQIAMDEDDKAKTAFTTPVGLYEFSVMPMGCKNGPATFQRVMELVLRGLCNAPSSPFCRVYFDDVLSASKTIAEQLCILKSVFDRVRSVGLKFKLSKCSFLQTELVFLGHHISVDGVKADPQKVSCVEDWPVPKSIHDIRSFLGFTGYYRRFIQSYAQKSAPLAALTGKHVKFHWSKACAASFRLLKSSLCSAPVLAYPDFSLDAGKFVLDTDASNLAIGGVLSQVQQGVERPIAFGSRILSKSERNYDASEREALALVHFLAHFRVYLLGRPFQARTDNTALTALRSLKEPRGRKARWLELLAEYDFVINHRPGRIHRNADCLSRVPSPPAEDVDQPVCATAATTSSTSSSPAVNSEPLLNVYTAKDLAKAQDNDVDLAVVRRWYDAASGKLVRPPEDSICTVSRAVRYFWAEADCLRMKDGVLYLSASGSDAKHVQDRLLVPYSLQEQAMLSVHALPSSGHHGIDKTLHLAGQRFCWFGMSQDIAEFVHNCAVCLTRKSKTSTNVAPLQPMAAGYPFAFVAIDIVGPLPVSARGNRYILVAIDYFTRWAEAYPVANISAESVASAFVDGWITRFGVPERLHSDQGAQFESRLFSQLCSLLGICKSRTTAYHPQGDGRVERVNRTLVTLLRSHILPDDRDWDLKLSFALLAYRTSRHVSTGYTPFRMLMGAEVRLPADVVFPLPSLPEMLPHEYVQFVRKELVDAHRTAREKIGLDHQHQEELYNRRCHGEPIAVGSFVYLHNPAVKPGFSPKFHVYWQGPFRVIDRISMTSYVLDINGSRRVVHFNRLKPAARQLSAELPDDLPHELSTSMFQRRQGFVYSYDDNSGDGQQLRRSGRIPTVPAKFADYVLY